MRSDRGRRGDRDRAGGGDYDVLFTSSVAVPFLLSTEISHSTPASATNAIAYRSSSATKAGVNSGIERSYWRNVLYRSVIQCQPVCATSVERMIVPSRSCTTREKRRSRAG